MQLTDTVEIGGVRRTRDGYLVADAKVARTGIQLYRGSEVGKPEMAVVRVYRPESEVFANDAMASVAWRPVTNEHPAQMVDATNWKDLSVGMTGSDVVRDGAFIRVPLTLMDKAAIDAVAAGKRELSLGYSCELDFRDGDTPAGEAYDAVQSNIRVNHLAICSAARGGPDLKIGDQKERPEGGPTVANLKTIIVDGLPVETTDAGEAAVNKLKGLLDTSAKALTDAQAAHTAAIAAKDAELGKKDAEIADLKTKVVDGPALDALVADRAKVVERAKVLAPTLDTAGKTNAEIRRAAVAAKLGDVAVKDKSDDYVGALFDHAGASQAPDALRQVVADGVTTIDDAKKARDTARAAYLTHLNTAHRGEPATA
jgi:hypothetical protein